MIISHILIAVATLIHALVRLFAPHRYEKQLAAFLTSVTVGTGLMIVVQGGSVVQLCKSLVFYVAFLGLTSVVRARKTASTQA